MIRRVSLIDAVLSVCGAAGIVCREAMDHTGVDMSGFSSTGERGDLSSPERQRGQERVLGSTRASTTQVHIDRSWLMRFPCLLPTSAW